MAYISSFGRAPLGADEYSLDIVIDGLHEIARFYDDAESGMLISTSGAQKLCGCQSRLDLDDGRNRPISIG
jgi:hypothetical protein